MKKTKKGIAFLGGMAAVFLLFTGIVMKTKAEGTATASVTIWFTESIDSDAVDSIQREITISDFVKTGEGTDNVSYSGTIDLTKENITYEYNSSEDIRNIISWYGMGDEGIVPISSTFSLSDVSVEEADGVYCIILYAVYGNTILINYDNNAAYMGLENSRVVSKYYPQTDASENEKMINLPASPSELSNEFVLDGYEFKGWGETDSGEVEIKEITLGYGQNTKLYAHWKDLRPEEDFVTESGQVYLEAGKPYTLGDGTWTVNGGSTNYSGGITFYVTNTGTYTFSK